MKISPVSLKKTTEFGNFGTKTNTETDNKATKIDTWDKQMFALTCCMTAFPGVAYIKKGVRENNWVGKAYCIFEGVGMTLGMALMLMPLWKFIKKINSDN